MKIVKNRAIRSYPSGLKLKKFENQVDSSNLKFVKMVKNWTIRSLIFWNKFVKIAKNGAVSSILFVSNSPGKIKKKIKT